MNLCEFRPHGQNIASRVDIAFGNVRLGQLKERAALPVGIVGGDGHRVVEHVDGVIALTQALKEIRQKVVCFKLDDVIRGSELERIG